MDPLFREVRSTRCSFSPPEQINWQTSSHVTNRRVDSDARKLVRRQKSFDQALQWTKAVQKYKNLVQIRPEKGASCCWQHACGSTLVTTGPKRASLQGFLHFDANRPVGRGRSWIEPGRKRRHDSRGLQHVQLKSKEGCIWV